MNLGEFREFAKDMSDETEIRIVSVYKPDETFHGAVKDVFKDDGNEMNYIVFVPMCCSISDGTDSMGIQY